MRPHTHEHQDFRGFAGRIDGGIYKPGDTIKVLPSGFTSTMKTIELYREKTTEAFAPMYVTMTLEDEIGVIRGDMIVRENNPSEIGQDIDVLVNCMIISFLQARIKVVVKHTINECMGIVKE